MSDELHALCFDVHSVIIIRKSSERTNTEQIQDIYEEVDAIR